MDNTIQEAIDAIEKVLNIHENHFFEVDRKAFEEALSRLELMKQMGFK